MSYMDLLSGNTRTNAATIERAPMFTIASTQQAKNVAATIERNDDDSRDFRNMRVMMHQTHCRL